MQSPFQPIPMPQHQDIFQGMVEAYLKAKEAKQMDEARQAQIAETANYHKDELGIQQQAEDRQKQLLPYLLQKYQMEQQQAQNQMNLYNQIFGINGANGTNVNNGTNNSINNTNNPVKFSKITPISSIVPLISSAQSNLNTPTLVGNAASITNQKLPNNIVNAPQPSMIPASSQPSQSGVETNVPVNSTNNQNKFSQFQQQLDSGSEIMVRPPSPGRQNWDLVPGTTVSGIKIPTVSSNITDGVQTKYYPSGMITKQKVGPSQEEKAQISLNAAEEREQAKSNIAQTKLVNERMRTISNTADTLKNIREILMRNNDLTGKIPTVEKFFGFNKNKDFAALTNLFGDLQGQLADMFNSKAGFKTINWVKGIKPSTFQPQEFNEGMVNASIKKLNQMIDEEEQRYKDLNGGKEMPTKIEKLEEIPESHKLYKIENKKTGESKMVSRDEAMKMGLIK